MTKQHILSEIRRTAGANGGVPLGKQRFFAETGIKDSDWLGKFWARWGDAVKEAGFQPNELQAARTSEDLLNHLAALVRELGRFPVMAEIKLKARTDPAFPSHNTFGRFGESKRSPRSWGSLAGTEVKMILRNCVLRRPGPTMPKTQKEFPRRPPLSSWATST
jgi:hypothetical protein